jgi:Flp pilus assembly protein TadG
MPASPLRHPLRLPRRAAPTAAADLPGRRSRAAERGQVIVIFAGGIVLFMLLLAVVVDVSWYWANTLRVQRAADAAALAGAVYLPGNVGTAVSTARAEATKNGYVNGTNAVVTPTQDTNNNRQLNVTVSANVGTFFMRVIGISSIAASRSSKAEYVLPVPMGSPENYYGVFGTLRGATYTEQVTTTNTTYASGDTGWRVATAVPTGGLWTFSSGNITSAVNSDNNVYAYETTNGEAQQWRAFGMTIPTPTANQNVTILGIEVRLQDAFVSATCASTRIRAALSWDVGGTFVNLTTPVETPNLGTSTTAGDYTLGSAANTTAWGTRTWSRTDFSDTNFRVRLTAVKGCATAATRINLDMLEVRVSYQVATTTTTTTDVTTTTNDLLEGPGTACANGAANCYNPDGTALNPRGFWATMNTRGASNVNGDAHQPYYDTAGSTVAPVCPAGDSRACYDPAQYYNYAVEMPPGSTGGYVYVFDPGFCATVTSKGTGDRWFGSQNAVSSWYELRGTNNTPYNLTDDPLIASTGSLFTNLDAADSTMGGSGGAECRKGETGYGDGRDYHLSWYLLNPGNPLTGGPSGTIYRIHTTGTDPGGSLLSTTDGEQSFALYVSASDGTPRIYGLGSMQMFTPLSSTGGSTSSEFYLAQIEAVHAGKTVEIQLWDPGDTSPLTANLQILVPNSGGWSATPLSYRAKGGTSNSAVNTACNSNTGTNVTSIVTEATGSNPGEFNGCWITITIPIPATYTGAQDGWWKIRYNMTGNGTSNDVTTWKVSIRGNPVHLKVP